LFFAPRQEVRLLVGCALGNVLRIRAPEVPYEADETLKARARKRRGRAPASCRHFPGPDSCAPGFSFSCALDRPGATRAQEVYRLFFSCIRMLEDTANSASFDRAAALLSTLAKARGHPRDTHDACKRSWRVSARPSIRSRASRARRQVKCFVPMLDLASGAPELVADLLRACLDTVKCARRCHMHARAGSTKNAVTRHHDLCANAPRVRLSSRARARPRSAANVASVEMDIVKARARACVLQWRTSTSPCPSPLRCALRSHTTRTHTPPPAPCPFDGAAQLLSDLLEESEEAAPGWVAALLAALVPPAPAERQRIAAAVLARAEASVAPAAQRRVEALLDAATPHHHAGDAAAPAPAAPAAPALVAALSCVWPGLPLTLAPAFDAALRGDDARRAAAVGVLSALFAAPRSAAAGEYRPLFGAFLSRFRDRAPPVREAMARFAGAFLTAFTPRREPGAAPPPDTPDGRAAAAALRGGGGGEGDNDDDGGAPVAEVCACLEASLLDFEASVRGAAGAAVTAAAAARPSRVSAQLLLAARRLLADKKAVLRRDALRGLAGAYAAHATRAARHAHNDAPAAARHAAMFDPLPGALLLACAADGELGRGAVDALLDGGLVPHALSPQDAAAAWLRARAAADAPGGKAMDAAMRLRAEPRAAAGAWLAARRAQRSADADADPDALDARADADAAAATVERALGVLARTFPAPHDALGALRRLHGARDGHIFRALEALLAPDVALYGAAGAARTAPSAAALRADALRRLGAKHPAAEVAAALCVKLCPAPLDAAAVSALFALLDDALGGAGGGGGAGGSDSEEGEGHPGAALPADAASALSLLACAAAGTPAAFAPCLPSLLPLLTQRRGGAGDAVLDGALRVLAAAAPALRGVAGAPALRAPLTSLTTAGSVPQAKRAAACLVALQRDAAPALAAGLADALPRLCDDALAPALAALAALAAAAPEALPAPRADALQRFVTRTLLPRPPPPAQRGAAGGISPAVALKVRGVLALARACCPAAAAAPHGAPLPPAAAARAAALSAEVLEPLLRGAGACFAAASGGAPAGSADGVALRAGAARALLKLARARHDAALPPSAFAALASAATDAAPLLRAAVLTPLLKAARARKLPSSRVCALLPLALCAAASHTHDGAAAAEARRALAAVVDTLRASSDACAAPAPAAAAAGGRAPTPAVTRAPEYMLLYLLWALSRHPAVPATPAAAAATKCDAWLRVVQPPLRALCDALLAAPRAQHGIFSPGGGGGGGAGGGGGGGAPCAAPAGAALPLLLKLCRQVKLSEDAAEPVHNHALYALADVTAALLVDSARAHGWDSTARTALTAPMPSRYFTMAATPRLGPLSPAAAAGTIARPRPSASFLPAHFALLPEEAPPAHDGAPRAKTPKKRRRAAPRGGGAGSDDDDDDDDDLGGSASDDGEDGHDDARAAKRRKPAPHRPAAKKVAKRGGKATAAPVAASRLQPRRGATRAPLLAEVSSDDSDRMEEEEEQEQEEEAPPPARVRKPAASKPPAASPPAAAGARSLAAAPARAAPSASMEVEEEEEAAVMAWSPPPARAAAPPARPAAGVALLRAAESSEEEDDKDKALNPKPHARRAAPPQPPPQASPPPPAKKAATAPEPAAKGEEEDEEEEEDEPQLRKSGRRRRRR
jgi:hypothetical protein